MSEQPNVETKMMELDYTGIALDALVAEVVFGWKRAYSETTDIHYWVVPEGDPFRDQFGSADFPPPYSTDAEAMLQVLAKFNYWQLFSGDYDPNTSHPILYCCNLWHGAHEGNRATHVNGTGKTPQIAAARAAVMAVWERQSVEEDATRALATVAPREQGEDS